MRQYIRHPSAMPVEYRTAEGGAGCERLRNISAGGACFTLQQALSPGKAVHLTIRLGEQDFEADGEVVWCRGVNGHHELGLRFLNAVPALAVQMVEQLCCIEQYRQHVRHAERRDLSSEQAASESADLFAGDFSRYYR